MATKRLRAGGAVKRRALATSPGRGFRVGIPRVTGQQGMGTAGPGVPLQPFKGPEIPLPPNEDEAIVERWQAWQASVGGQNGSLPEFLCWEWLVFKKRQVPFVDFAYQFPILGGRTLFGGFVLDYYFPQRDIAWFIQGLRFHFTDPQDRARDMLAKTLVSGRGVTVVEVFEDDLMERLDFTLNLAWEGRQVGGRERV